MSKDIVQSSIECLANMPIEDTTYQVARSVVLDEIERLNNIIKEVREYCNNRICYFNEKKRDYNIEEIEEEYDFECILEILDKGE